MSLKFITRGWDRFFSHIVFEVGDGSSISFWHIRWCDGVCLRDHFPFLFVLLGEKDVRVFDYLERSPSSVVWSSVFVRPNFSEMIVFIIFSPCLIRPPQRPPLLIRLGEGKPSASTENSSSSLISLTFLHLLAIRPCHYQIATFLGILSGGFGPL